jgi:hypothetical protein
MADENERRFDWKKNQVVEHPPPMLRSTREMICRETIHGLFYTEHEYFPYFKEITYKQR